MKFKIGPVTYDMSSLDLLSLKDILLLEKETAELGNPLRWSDIQRMAQDAADMKTDAERQANPDGMWVLAFTIWASRRVAGETLAFGDAIDFPMRDLTWIEEPQDRKKPAGPTKARPGSGRAAKRLAPAAAGSVTTSQAASTDD